MKKLMRQLEAKQKALAKLRDDLRELAGEVDRQADSAERGCELLQDALDALSELV